MDEKLLQYFIEQTNDRLNKIDANIEKLLAFRFKLIGAVITVSFIISLAVSLLKL